MNNPIKPPLAGDSVHQLHELLPQPSARPTIVFSPSRWLVSALVLTYTGDALAYIDPGTGTLVLQGLLALIGGLVVFMRHPIQTMRSLWARLRKKRD